MKRELKEFVPKAKEIGEMLGWDAIHSFRVEFDMNEVGDLALHFDTNGGTITDKKIDKIRELVPEAKEIEFFPKENGWDQNVWIYLYTGEEDIEKEDKQDVTYMTTGTYSSDI